mgnify:CR=1 FL=1
MSNTERVLYFPEGKIMKTIICDDEKSTCSELEEIILKYAKEKSVSLVTEVFYSGDTLLDYLKREKINILFSGYRIARERWSYGRQIYKRGS